MKKNIVELETKSNEDIESTLESTDNNFKIVNYQHYLIPLENPLIPFAILNYILSNYLELFIKVAAISCESKNNSDVALTTSCVNSAYASSLIFFGEPVAKKIFKRLRKQTSAELSVQLPSGKKWLYKVKNIFGGDIIREMNNKITVDEDVPDDKLINYAQSSINSFFNYTEPFVTKCVSENSSTDEKIIANLKDYFSKMEYDFNASTISALKSEIDSNKQKTNQDRTYVYFVAITIPSDDRMKFEHAFLIEQFFLNECKEIRYRIYQSWIEEATLLDEFSRRGYDESGNKSLTSDEINNFIDNFEALYGRNKNHNNVTYRHCFGYTNSVRSGPLLTFDGKILSGLSIRYFSMDIDPKQCTNNFINLIFSEDTSSLNTIIK